MNSTYFNTNNEDSFRKENEEYNFFVNDEANGQDAAALMLNEKNVDATQLCFDNSPNIQTSYLLNSEFNHKNPLYYGIKSTKTDTFSLNFNKKYMDGSDMGQDSFHERVSASTQKKPNILVNNYITNGMLSASGSERGLEKSWSPINQIVSRNAKKKRPQDVALRYDQFENKIGSVSNNLIQPYYNESQRNEVESCDAAKKNGLRKRNYPNLKELRRETMKYKKRLSETSLRNNATYSPRETWYEKEYRLCKKRLQKKMEEKGIFDVLKNGAFGLSKLENFQPRWRYLLDKQQPDLKAIQQQKSTNEIYGEIDKAENVSRILKQRNNLIMEGEKGLSSYLKGFGNLSDRGVWNVQHWYRKGFPNVFLNAFRFADTSPTRMITHPAAVQKTREPRSNFLKEKMKNLPLQWYHKFDNSEDEFESGEYEKRRSLENQNYKIHLNFFRLKARVANEELNIIKKEKEDIDAKLRQAEDNCRFWQSSLEQAEAELNDSRKAFRKIVHPHFSQIVSAHV